MVFLIFDTETSSLQGGVVEIAWMWVDSNLKILAEACHRVNPERPIEAEAYAIHGISDADVANCPVLAEVCKGFTRPVPACGHNIGFDIRMVKPHIQVSRSLCTLALARQYIKDVENCKLENLQKVLGLPVQKSHSALGDVHTCRDLLLHILPIAGVGIEELFRRAETPRMLTHMPFGRYEGRPILEVPSGYRNWLLFREIDKDLRLTLETIRDL